jgi:hypothetical protein
VIKEEYSYKDISTYLKSSIDLLIVGNINIEERRSFFYNEFKDIISSVLFLEREKGNKLNSTLLTNNIEHKYQCDDISILLPIILQENSIVNKNVLLDITSLDHVTIMTIFNILINKVRPKKLFAGYVCPMRYKGSKENYLFTLTSELEGIMTIPGLARIEKPSESVCVFLGFEGGRFQRIIELINETKNIYPIFSLPLINLNWMKISMWNSLDILKGHSSNSIIHKCSAESIFDALQLLDEISRIADNTVLVPLGTRPHSAGCAIFASTKKNTRIIYDYAVETHNRSEGIGNITIYNLTKLIHIIK